MRKFVDFVQPIKAFAAMMFGGLMCLYMVSGFLYAFFTGADFDYSIPFVFLLQGMGLTIAIALLRELIFGDVVIKKWRFFRRIIVFCILLMMLLVVCFLTFFAIPIDWAYLWLIAVGVLVLGVTIMFGLSEIYYRKTGEWYTEMLRIYKEGQCEVK